MVVGVMNKRFSNGKLIGTIVNYSLTRGLIKVRVLLDANKKRLTIFSPSNPQGEVFTDLPKDGLFYPAIQNKSKIHASNALRVDYKYELAIPTDKSLIPIASYSSEEEQNNTFDMNEDSEFIN